MIRVYIHGRPQGQDTWSSSPAPNDKFYLNPFLDSKIGEDMNAVMQVDVWQNKSYYSYIHRKNVLEKGNRPSAYFAITVCFEKQLCTQVATLDDLLESVYTQIFLNNIIEKTGEQEHFLISQFKEKEAVLNQATNVILQNIEKYISGSLAAVEKAVDTTKTQFRLYANVDVDSPQFIADCASNRVLISPEIITKDKLPLELRMQMAAIESKRAKLEEERNSWQSKAEHEQKENGALKVKRQDLQDKITKLEQQVESIKGEVSKEYQSQIQDLQKRLNSVQQEQNNLNRELAQEKQSKKTLREDNDRLKNQILQLQKGKQTASPQPSAPSSHGDIISSDIQDQLYILKNDIRRMAGRFPVLYKTVTMVATLLNTALLIGIIVLYCLGIPKTDNSINSTNSPVEISVSNIPDTTQCQAEQQHLDTTKTPQQ